MTEADKKFMISWTNKIERGKLQFFLKMILLCCLVSAVIILLYTWKNIPENKFFQSIPPLSILIFGFGIPMGLFAGWQFWTQNTKRYRSLITDGEQVQGLKKIGWFKRDKIWHIVATSLGGVYFFLLYLSIFLFDSPQHPAIAYWILWSILSYIFVVTGYDIYRYIVDKKASVKVFPIFFKISLSLIFLSTVIFFCILFNIKQ